MSSALYAAKSMALEYLEKEKEQIIKAMNYGLGNEKEIELGEYYYNQTYNQNK